MQLRFHCPNCDLPMRLSRWESLQDLVCPRCEKKIPTYVDRKAKEELKLDHCLVCNEKNLFIQKTFNRNFGIAIVVAGILVSFFVSLPIIPLLVVAAIDLILYLTLPMMMVCYQCDAEYRGFKVDEDLQGYDHLKAAKVKHQPTYPGAEEGQH